MDAESKQYELAYLLSPTLAETELLAKVGALTGTVEEGGGSVMHAEEPKRHKLAYAIKKEVSAYFGWLSFRVSPERVAAIQKKLDQESQILRYLLVEEEPAKANAGVRTFKPGVQAATKPRTSSTHTGTGRIPEPTTPQEPEDKRLDLEALDKKLEEILGR